MRPGAIGGAREEEEAEAQPLTAAGASVRKRGRATQVMTIIKALILTQGLGGDAVAWLRQVPVGRGSAVW